MQHVTAGHEAAPLFFREYGPPDAAAGSVVVLHGLLGCSDNWHNVGKMLAADFHVLVPDLRNHGRSFHSADFSYELLVQDLLAFFAARQLARASILGHSMGAKAAMLFACRHPERITRLIVADIAPRAYPPTPLPSFDALLAVDLSRMSRREEVDAALQPVVPDTAVRQLILKNLKRSATGGLCWRSNVVALYAAYPLLAGPLAAGPPHRGPALFLCSGTSGYVTEQDREAIPSLFPDCCFRTIPHAGHWLHAEAPDEFVRIVREFLLAESRHAGYT